MGKHSVPVAVCVCEQHDIWLNIVAFVELAFNLGFSLL